jgi:FMN reductase
VNFIVGGLVGNPRRGSKTLAACVSLVEKIVDDLHGSGAEQGPIIDLAVYGGRVLDYNDTELASLRDVVSEFRVLVVATPVYKGSYTGLLKSFLDGYGPHGLRQTITVPLTVAASPSHSLATTHHLQPLLDELGALSPAGGIFLPDAVSAEPAQRDERFDAWIRERGPFLRVSTPSAVGA